MTKQTHLFINTYSTENHHEMVNASMLLVVKQLFSDIIFHGSKSNTASIEKIFKNKCHEIGIVKKKVFAISGKSKMAHLLKYFVSTIQDIRLLLVSPSGSFLFYAYNNLFSLHLINWFNRFKKHKILIVCHGELELLQENSHKMYISMKIQSRLAKLFFLSDSIRIHRNLKFIVLGDSILQNLKNLLSSAIFSHFISIDHPYIFNDNLSKSNTEYDDLNFGTVGTLNCFKGSDNYVKLLSNKFSENIHFFAIGAVSDNYEDLNRLGVRLPTPNHMISRKDFDNSISILDYVLFLYPNDRYKLTASGAIFDAINYNKKIIAFKNDYFIYLFNKFGNIGYLVSNHQEMAMVINNIKNRPIEDFNFENFKVMLSPKNIANNLAKVI